ncbi:hypothetical protein [Streptomyces sp. NPDC054794]
MTEHTAPATELASQYINQVTSDLERNVKEQERIGAEIAALQEQLGVLQRDHSVLVNVQEALGIAAMPHSAEKSSTPPTAEKAAPRTAEKSTEKGSVPAQKRRKPAKAPAKTTSKTPAKKRTRTPVAAPKAPTSDQPTLVELVRAYLVDQREPRSSAEVATALGQIHPDRGVKTTVVRTTLENLVARNQAHRTKQGTSVFYTAPDTAKEAPAPEADGQPSETE